MASSDTELSHALVAPKKPRPRRHSLFLGLLMVVTMALAAAAVIGIWRYVKDSQDSAMPVTLTVAPQQLGQAPPMAELAQLRQQVQSDQEMIAALAGRVQRLELTAANGPTAAPTPLAQPAADTGHLQTDVASLSLALTNLQAQIDANGRNGESERKRLRDAVGLAVALMQLRLAAGEGDRFTAELRTLRQSAGGDGAVQDAVAQLDTAAKDGVPDYAWLHDDFVRLTPALAAAGRDAGATDWKSRIIAKLQGLVTIRHLHPDGSSDDSLDRIAALLDAHRLDAALNLVAALPDAEQAVLKDWRDQAAARQQFDAAMAAVTARLIAMIEANGDNDIVPAPGLSSPSPAAP